MARLARDMLQQAVRAVITHDACVAGRLHQADTAVDQLYQDLMQTLLMQMRADPAQSEWATYLLWIAHNLERMADRSVTIAERAAFISSGVLASHHTMRDTPIIMAAAQSILAR
jgi:phosphate transport system protein